VDGFPGACAFGGGTGLFLGRWFICCWPVLPVVPLFQEEIAVSSDEMLVVG